MLVVRDLMFKGFHEFREFLDSGEGIASNILSDRLKRLVAGGLVAVAPHPTDGKKKLYYLTGEGKSLYPLMVELTVWGADHTPDTYVPPEILGGMRKHRDEFGAAVMAGLAEWEREFLGGGA